jgi:hypothetical protein
MFWKIEIDNNIYALNINPLAQRSEQNKVLIYPPLN